MSRLWFLSLLFLLAAPALAKPDPLSCGDLWSAVMETLGNKGNYIILASDSERMRASFLVVGSLFPAVNVLSLKAKDQGCDLLVRMGFTGNDDEFALRRRVRRAVSKRKQAKPAPLASAAGASASQ